MTTSSKSFEKGLIYTSVRVRPNYFNHNPNLEYVNLLIFMCPFYPWQELPSGIVGGGKKAVRPEGRLVDQCTGVNQEMILSRFLCQTTVQKQLDFNL